MATVSVSMAVYFGFLGSNSFFPCLNELGGFLKKKSTTLLKSYILQTTKKQTQEHKECYFVVSVMIETIDRKKKIL